MSLSTFLWSGQGLKSSAHLSHSRVQRYLLCPEQYRLHYIENLRARVVAASLVFGQAIHQAIAQRLGQGKDALRSFDETWEVLKEFPMRYSRNETWQGLKDRGCNLLKKFLEVELPKITEVRAIEQPFRLSIPNIDMPLVGVVDLVANVDGTPTVVDFKTAGSSYDEHDVRLSDQLSAYKLAYPGVSRLALCVLVKTKEPRIEWHVTGEVLVNGKSRACVNAHTRQSSCFWILRSE